MPTLREKISTNKHRVLRTLARRLNNPDGLSRPVFLVGCGRSGTSMMVQQLGKSWQVEVYNENHPAAFENWFLKDQSRIAALTDLSLAPVVVFKPILETYKSRWLLSVFPDARLLFAFRHFDDVVNSSLRKFGLEDRISHVRGWMANDFEAFSAAAPPESTRALIRELWRPDFGPVEGAALYWLFTNRLYLDLGLHADPRSMLVRYEEFIARPADLLESVCAFIGIRFEESMLGGIRNEFVGKDPPSEMDESVRRACSALWESLSPAALDFTSRSQAIFPPSHAMG